MTVVRGRRSVRQGIATVCLTDGRGPVEHSVVPQGKKITSFVWFDVVVRVLRTAVDSTRKLWKCQNTALFST